MVGPSCWRDPGDASEDCERRMKSRRSLQIKRLCGRDSLAYPALSSRLLQDVEESGQASSFCVANYVQSLCGSNKVCGVQIPLHIARKSDIQLLESRLFHCNNRMHISAPPSLGADEIDDVLYFTRVNEGVDLQQTVSELVQKHECSAKDVLEACIDPETSNTVLHYCSANGFVDLLQGLLTQLSEKAQAVANGKAADRPQLINRQNAQGNTALHWAAYNGHLEIVKLLVKEGADMWVKNTAGHLAMFEAERADKNEVVQYLLEVGGREVERTGQEGTASKEDEVEVHNAADGADGLTQAGVVNVEMDEAVGSE
jgi:hypothetical protein